MDRRDFLMLRAGHAGNMAVLSCEQLYMRYVDARANGTDEALFQDLSDDQFHIVKECEVPRFSVLILYA